MIQYIDVLVTLIAGVLYTIVMMINGTSLDEWLLNLIIIMIVAMILGRIFKKYVMKNILNDKEAEQPRIEPPKVEEDRPNFISEFKDDTDEEYEEDED